MSIRQNQKGVKAKRVAGCRDKYELRLGEPLSSQLLRNLIVWVQLPVDNQESLDICLEENILTIKEAARAETSGTELFRPDIVGDSKALRACLDLVAQAADSEAAVLITGETGTGKELFARAIHQNSRRERKRFVVVDCRAILEPMAKKLLFGQQRQEGLLQQAEYGTLFLDEVGDLPMSTQQLFLKLLQDQSYRSSGRRRGFASSFRLIAATNRKLEQLAQQGKFSRGLLALLQPVQIEIPPLRNRLDDIDLLTDYFLQRYSRTQQLAIKARSPEFMEMLQLYPWPGNIRELINSLEQAMLAAKNKKTLFPKDLPAHIRVQVKKSSIENKNIRTKDQQQEPFWSGLLIADNPL